LVSAKNGDVSDYRRAIEGSNMFIRTQSRSNNRRRGVILLVVLALLTLFAIVGISFVLYSDAEATAARVNREGQSLTQADMQAELALSLILGQLLYDAPDDTGIYSSLRGQSLARNMYGYCDDPNVLNDKAYNGTGRLRGENLAPEIAGIDSSLAVNYTYFAPGFLRDPERLGFRAGPSANRGLYTGGLNVSYTYPDHNNFYLAMQRASDGKIQIPSFHRPWIFGNLADPNNPNWTNSAGKYLTLRPRPKENPGFPMPADAGGDVKNLDWAPGGNDSIWIDINAPVMVDANGRKYKMLVAPLILDLDGRVNLNAHGNIRGLDANKNVFHASNQGWGPWEVNLSKVLKLDPTEWQNLFTGLRPGGPTTRPTVQGRYGFNRVAPFASMVNGKGISGGTFLRLNGPMDFNGVIDPMPKFGGMPGSPTGPIEYPAYPGVKTVAFQTIPYFDPDGYGNAVPKETTVSGTGGPNSVPNHPAVYNVMRPQDKNLLLNLPSFVRLLRLGGTGHEAISSDLVRLCPKNFADVKTRNLVTSIGYDLDYPGSPAYNWDPKNKGESFQFDTTRNSPWSSAVNFQTLANRGNTPSPSDYDPATWRSMSAAIGRLDLGRKLTDWVINNNKIDMTDQNNVQALKDRQQFAGDLFKTLRKATGALDPVDAVNAFGVASNEYKALRWLAQFAVNIVDFIDNDDFMTPFNWYGNEWVFGTETPRLVINEVYGQYDNDGKDNPKKVTEFDLNIWVELHNPMLPDNTPGDPNKNRAMLAFNGTPDTTVYQLLVTKPNTKLRDADNTLGNPDAGATLSTVNDWKTNANNNTQWQLVKPAWSAANPPAALYVGSPTQNLGFYVVAPKPKNGYQTNANPLLASTWQTPTLSITTKSTDPGADNIPKPTILLQRLANPYLPPQNNPNLGDPTKPYNPYVTIDYAENIKIWEGRTFDSAGNAKIPDKMTDRASYGKAQPHASLGGPLGAVTQWAKQQFKNPNPTGKGLELHTFYMHNGVDAPGGPPQKLTASPQTLQVPFNWLVHLDRQPISALELLHVSGYKPHELTQQFVTGASFDPTVGKGGTPYTHLAPWTDQDSTAGKDSRLYRFFDYVTVAKSRAAGLANRGRIPGKINLNGIWDREVFRAWCDAQPGNQFTEKQVDDIFDAIMAQRSPTADPDPKFPGLKIPNQNDRPFWSIATGMALANGADPLSAIQRGLDSGLLRAATPGGAASVNRLVEPLTGGNPFDHPYKRNELLTKLFNHFTTRSNVFAVWMTIGFFEVDDATGKLKAEIGRSENRNIRHRMFAILDRTNMQVWPTYSDSNNTVFTVQTKQPIQLPVTGGVADTSVKIAIDNTVLSQLTGTNPNTNRAWQIQENSVITIEPDTDNEETVTVQKDPNNGSLFAVFYQNHLANVGVISRGNPGPWTKYDPRQDTKVVPFFSMID
jgi:hypothetical protein